MIILSSFSAARCNAVLLQRCNQKALWFCASWTVARCNDSCRCKSTQADSNQVKASKCEWGSPVKHWFLLLVKCSVSSTLLEAPLKGQRALFQDRLTLVALKRTLCWYNTCRGIPQPQNTDALLHLRQVHLYNHRVIWIMLIKLFSETGVSQSVVLLAACNKGSNLR